MSRYSWDNLSLEDRHLGEELQPLAFLGQGGFGTVLTAVPFRQELREDCSRQDGSKRVRWRKAILMIVKCQ